MIIIMSMYLYWPEQVPGSQVKKADQGSQWLPTLSCHREATYGSDWEALEVMSDLDMFSMGRVVGTNVRQEWGWEPDFTILQCPIINGSRYWF